MIMAEASYASQREQQQEAEAHLRWLLEESGEFPDLPGLNEMRSDQIDSLGGGADSARYLVKGSDRDVVAKLNNDGLSVISRTRRAASARTTGAEHREHRWDRNQTDTTDVEVTYEFISSVVNRMAA